MIGPGVVINPEVFTQRRYNDFEVKDRAFIDKNCGIIEAKSS